MQASRSIGTQTRKLVQDLRSIIRTAPLRTCAIDTLLPPLVDALHLQHAIAFREAPIVDGHGWDVGLVSTWPSSYASVVRRHYGAFICSSMGPWPYNPLRPERSQRNRVLLFREAPRTPAGDALIRETYPPMGLVALDRIRVLVCDGHRLQRWFGAFRQEPFGERDRCVFAGIVPALVERLRLEEALGTAGVVEQGLEAALGLLCGPAFLIDHRARIAVASDSGVKLLEADARRTRARLLDALRGRTRDTVIPVGGDSSWQLIILRSTSSGVVERIARATRMWNLTPRQAEVLAHLVQGDANKTIADKLDCAPGTIELHVSAILAKAEVESRAALIALFWR